MKWRKCTSISTNAGRCEKKRYTQYALKDLLKECEAEKTASNSNTDANKMIINAGEKARTAGDGVNWYNHCASQCGSASKS